MTFPRPWPYDYPGVTRPDLGGLRGGRSFFEELRLGEAPPLGGEAAWAAWQAELWPALERTALLPLLLAKDELHGHEARVYGARDGELSRRSRRFALLSPDALWDADLGGWRLEEINTNGLFQLGADEGEDVRTFHVDEGYTEAWLQIAGVDGYPRAPAYAAALDAALDDFCAGRGCDGRDREVLAAAAHENAHASSGWYRAWPPVDCGAACGARPDLADDAGVMALFEGSATRAGRLTSTSSGPSTGPTSRRPPRRGPTTATATLATRRRLLPYWLQEPRSRARLLSSPGLPPGLPPTPTPKPAPPHCSRPCFCSSPTACSGTFGAGSSAGSATHASWP